MKRSAAGFSCKIAVLALALLFLAGCGKKAQVEVPEGKVVKGTFYIDIHEEGLLEAVNSTTITTPVIPWRYGNLKITILVKDGEEVKKGDTVAIFDKSEVEKGILDAQSRLEINKAEYERLMATQQSELEELKADLEVTRISQEISKIRFELAAHESEIKKKEIQLNLEKAEIALVRVQEQITNRIKIQTEDAKQKRLSIQQDTDRLQEGYDVKTMLNLTTPSNGIAIINRNPMTGNKFQIGDNCWSSYPLIQLPDLSLLKAIVNINEVDIAKIETGMEVEIKPDAFSDSTFKGVVKSVANLAINKQGSTKIKVFPVEIYIEGTSKNLLPGLTVSCRIITEKIENVLYVPSTAIKEEGGKSYAFKKKGGGYEKVEVETGANNMDYVVIISGLEEKETIALADPFAAEKDKKADSAEKNGAPAETTKSN